MTSDFDKALDRWLEVWANYIRMFRSRKWRSKPPRLSYSAEAVTAFAGVYRRTWLPVPEKETIAALADRLELEHDPALVRGFAALVQRASIIDPEVLARVDDLVSAVESLGVLEHGCAGHAVQAQSELDRLLSSPATWSSLDEVLGGDYSPPEDLLNLAWARFYECEADGPWRELIVVIERLRWEMYRFLTKRSGLSAQECRQRMTFLSVLDLLSLVVWTDFSGVRMAAVQECLRSARIEVAANV